MTGKVPNRLILMVVLIITILSLSLSITIRPSSACSYGCKVSRPPYILIIYNQRVITIPIATIVFVEFLLLGLAYAIRVTYRNRIKIKDFGKIVMALGISMPPLLTAIGYAIGILFLINGPALYPTVTYGFYGFGYLPVFNGLYEYNPPQGKIWPTPLVFEIFAAIFLIGLILHIIMKAREKGDAHLV